MHAKALRKMALEPSDSLMNLGEIIRSRVDKKEIILQNPGATVGEGIKYSLPQFQDDVTSIVETSAIQSHIRVLYKSVEQLYKKLEEVNEKIIALENKSIIKNIKILSLDDDRLKIIRDIPVLLEIYEDEVIAKFVDVEVSGFGETEYEALDNLKRNIVSIYYELKEDKDSLGPLPQKWLEILKNIIEEK